MTQSKTKRLKPFEKLLKVMITGKPVSIEEIETTLGSEIHMYRISTYMWHIKVYAQGTIKTIRNGRKAYGYQLMNPQEVDKGYMVPYGIK